jgi:hypothetical protein
MLIDLQGINSFPEENFGRNAKMQVSRTVEV